MAIKQVTVIADEDGHFVSAIRQENNLVIAHRHWDKKEFSDPDDLILSDSDAQKVLFKLGELLSIKEELIIKTTEGKLEVLLSEDKKTINLFHENKNGIRLGFDEAKILFTELKQKLSGGFDANIQKKE